MSRHEDRGLIRRAVKDGESKRKRWGAITDDFKDQAVQALRVALRMALEKQDHRAVTSCVQTLGTLESQNQSDEHLDRRLDAGEHEGGSGKTVVVVQYVNRLPGSGERESAASPSGAVAGHPQLPQVQRFDVRATLGQDHHG